MQNKQIATIDLFDNLGSPQTPWPLVQPFPNFEPIPTRNPEMAKPVKDKSEMNWLFDSKKTFSL